jgi:urease accessory protein
LKRTAMLAPLERSNGIARISFKHCNESTVLDDLYQQGSAKIKLGRPEPGRLCEAVIINTSGGMTGGDRFSVSAKWARHATAIVTTQAAERIYKSSSGEARVTSQLEVAEEACALWLPQETIMFDKGAYQRQTNVDMTGNGVFLGLESSVYGRHAMGETVTSGQLTERWQLRRDGRLIFADAFGLAGAVDDQLLCPAIAGGARALATLVYAGPDCLAIRDAINSRLENSQVSGRATCFDDITVARLFAAEGQKLRSKIVSTTNDLLIRITKRPNSAALLPRVWMM